MAERIEIRQKRSWSALMVLGAALFVAVGLWFIAEPAQVATRGGHFTTNPLSVALVFLAGIAAVVFFGAALVIALLTLFGSPSLYVMDDRELCFDPKHGRAVRWTNVLDLQLVQVARSNLIAVLVRNPQVVIAGERNALRRWSMRFNLRRFQSPLVISPRGLSMSFEELHEELERRIASHRRAEPEA